MRYVWLLVLTLVLGSSASGAEPAPKTTDDFIHLCDAAAPSRACLLEYQIVVAANDWESGGSTCEPSTAASDMSGKFTAERNVIRAIVPWLKQHPEYASQDDTKGVEAALQALYPCKK